MRILLSPFIALASLTFLAVPDSMADATGPGTSPSIQQDRERKRNPHFKFKLTEWPRSGEVTAYTLRDDGYPYPKGYMLQDYLAALEQFLKEQQAHGVPLEKITCFSTFSLGRAKDIQEKFKRLAREGKSRVSKKDGHHMSVCARLVREEKLLAPYKEIFKRFGLEVDDTLMGESKMARAPLDVPGRKHPVYYFTEGMVNLKLAPLKTLEHKAPSKNKMEPGKASLAREGRIYASYSRLFYAGSPRLLSIPYGPRP